MRISRVLAGALTIALVASACGIASNSDDLGAEAPQDEPAAAETETESVPVEADPPAPQHEATATASPSEEPADNPAPEQEPGPNQLPVVEVLDLATGQNVNLASYAPADRPILLWFWAPH